MVARADDSDILYIDTEAALANEAGNEAVGIAMDLITRVWWPTRSAFVFDPDKLATRLSRELPARGYTAELLRRRRCEVATFFTILPDGRWAPSPEYFSATDGKAERSGGS
jgi:hypothetical protein